eukprot:TRINITY_DN9626_c0_g2_i34.p1 TRINITY_DN9626_c0_g2~~TRINITY_DN9626_c0_g2_i34.p1  ORF type:complete len:277 (-),score=58.36 TRINITY_DN9626_c0_g2_i34:693-1523(-)
MRKAIKAIKIISVYFKSEGIMQADLAVPAKRIKYNIHLSAATWSKDSHGLFDYEDFSVKRNNLLTRGVKFLVRVPNTPDAVDLLSEKEITDSKVPIESILLKIVPNKENPEVFQIENCSRTGKYEDAIDKLWLIIKSLQRDGEKEEYKLSRGEILKLGRVRLKVKDYRLDGSEAEETKSNEADDNPTDVRKCNDMPRDRSDQCRVCFRETNTETDPLLSLCKCTGSVKFIHLVCLKTWLNQKLTKHETASLVSYYWKSFDCEICKALYPRKLWCER